MYLSLFYGILPVPYMNNLCCLSYAVFLLYQRKISKSDRDLARKLICEFCTTFSALYGERYQTLNFHNLLHLVDNVENIGPLWSFDCFAFENASGQILKQIHGTQHIDTQILKAVSVLQKLPILIRNLQNSCPNGKTFAATMMTKCISKLEKRLGDHMYALGKVTRVAMSGEYRNLITIFLKYVLLGVEILQFVRYRNGNVVFHSKMYKRVKRRNSYTVMYVEDGVKMFGMIKCCMTLVIDNGFNSEERHVGLIECLDVLHDCLGLASHIKVVKNVEQPLQKLVLLENIAQVCVWLEFEDILDVSFISLIPNISKVA